MDLVRYIGKLSKSPEEHTASTGDKKKGTRRHHQQQKEKRVAGEFKGWRWVMEEVTFNAAFIDLCAVAGRNSCRPHFKRYRPVTRPASGVF